jgi:hypothetical protein
MHDYLKKILSHYTVIVTNKILLILLRKDYICQSCWFVKVLEIWPRGVGSAQFGGRGRWGGGGSLTSHSYSTAKHNYFNHTYSYLADKAAN